ncbi:hypothetical protein PENTCL1PPCAC_30176, partial [Pristionchus entomophagus]
TRSPRAGTSSPSTTPSSRLARARFSMACSARSARISSIVWRTSERRPLWTTSSRRLRKCATNCLSTTFRRTSTFSSSSCQRSIIPNR